MNSVKDKDIISEIVNIAWMLAGLGVVVYVLLMQEDKFFAVWRLGRLSELYVWHVLTYPFGTQFFQNGIDILWQTQVPQISWSWLFEFESYYNRYLRFFYAACFFSVGGKILYNYFFVTKQYSVQSMIELYANESEAIETLVHDNPLKHHRVYDFELRDDFHNRHAQAMQPTQYFSACPPPNATEGELSKWQLDKGKNSHRPIGIIDRNNEHYDFSRLLAKRSFERQLTNPPSQFPYYSDEGNVPRLFDEKGELVPLDYDDEGHIVGGFATNKLLNNGRTFKGTADEVPLLFSSIEREILHLLCERYNHPSISLETLLLELLSLHGYSRTFLVALFNLVRENSVVASTEFYLIQRKDRILYFCLYSASEEKPFWEATGVMAHYHIEVKIGKKVTTPCVMKAVDALEKEFKRVSAWKPTDSDVFTRLSEAMVNDPDLQRRYMDESTVEKEYSSLDDLAHLDRATDSSERQKSEVHHG